MTFKSITLTPGQVTILINALSLCDCNGSDNCVLCETRRSAIGMLSTAKISVKYERADNDIVLESRSSWDIITDLINE